MRFFVFLFLAFTFIKAEDFNEENLTEISQKSWIIDDSLKFQTNNKIAILIPEIAVGSYGESVKNGIFAYILSNNLEMDAKVYYCGDENESSLQKALDEINEDEASIIIAAVSSKGAKFIDENAVFGKFYYIPTLPKSFGSFGNIIYGGIDYRSQTKTLSKIAKKPIYFISDTNYISEILNEYFDDEIKPVKILRSSNFDFTFLKELDKVPQNSSVVLNLAPYNAKIILDNLQNQKLILSTQINFTPEILNYGEITKNLIIANSIDDEIPPTIENFANVFNINLKYDWIAYSSMIGLDYFYNGFINLKHKSVFKNKIKDRALNWPPALFKIENGEFVKF